MKNIFGARARRELRNKQIDDKFREMERTIEYLSNTVKQISLDIFRRDFPHGKFSLVRTKSYDGLIVGVEGVGLAPTVDVTKYTYVSGGKLKSVGVNGRYDKYVFITEGDTEYMCLYANETAKPVFFILDRWKMDVRRVDLPSNVAVEFNAIHYQDKRLYW